MNRIAILALAALLPASPAMANGAAGPWDIQFTEPFALNRDVPVIDLDMDAPTQIRAAKARGQQVLCYVSVGTAEKWRRDYAQFPAEVKGPEWQEWPGEYFLDIRRADLAADHASAVSGLRRCRGRCHRPRQSGPAMGRSLCGDRGQFRVLHEGAGQIAAGIGLTIGQKNNPDTVDDLVGTLDFIVTEGCFAEGWCDSVLPYAVAGKPVYAIEYTNTFLDFAAACTYGRAHGVSFILKDLALDGQTYQSCD